MGITDFVLSNLTNGDCQTYSMINGNHEIKNYTEVNYTASRRHSFDLIIFPGEYCHVEVSQKLYRFQLYNSHQHDIINLKSCTSNQSYSDLDFTLFAGFAGLLGTRDWKKRKNNSGNYLGWTLHHCLAWWNVRHFHLVLSFNCLFPDIMFRFYSITFNCDFCKMDNFSLS